MKAGSAEPAEGGRNGVRTHDVELVRFSLMVGEAELRRLHATLTSDEAERAKRFMQRQLGERFIAARGRLREVLGAAAGCEPAAVAFDVAAHGKPTLRKPALNAPALNKPAGRKAGGASEPIHFNLTHSGETAAIALCRSAEIGIDIERIRTVREGLARRYFAALEVAALEAMPESQRQTAFFRCWTRKEAFLKATGEGIRRGLDSFVVTVGPDEEARVVSIDGEPDAGDAYHVADFDAGAAMAGAVCIHTGRQPNRVQITLRDLD